MALHRYAMYPTLVIRTMAQHKRNHLLITHTPDARSAALLFYLTHGLSRATICFLETEDFFSKEVRFFLWLPQLRPLPSPTPPRGD